MAKKPVFQYRAKVNDEESMAAYAKNMDKRATKQGGNFKGIISDNCKVWRPAKGENFIRILPPSWDDADHYGIDVHVHYSVGPEKATVLCLNQMKRKPCPVCQAKMRADRDHDEELSKQLSPRSQTLVWMVDMKEKQKGPQIWAMSYTVERDIAKLAKDRQTGELYLLDHPDEGYNVSFDRDGEGLKTKYSGFQIAKRPTSVEPEWLEHIMEFPLPDQLVWRDYDELKSIFEGGSDDDDEPEPAPRARARTEKPAEPEPEVETEDETVEKEDASEDASEPEPEPEPKPKADGKSRADRLRERLNK